MSLLYHIVDKKISHLLLRTFISHNLKQNTRCQQHQQLMDLSSQCCGEERHRLRRSQTGATRFIQTSVLNNSGNSTNMSGKPFLPKKALVLRKFSRLEYERLCHPDLSEEQLASNVSNRSDNKTALLTVLAY